MDRSKVRSSMTSSSVLSEMSGSCVVLGGCAILSNVEMLVSRTKSLAPEMTGKQKKDANS